MKRSLLVMFVTLVMIPIMSCDKDDIIKEENVKTNTKPVITLLSPSDNTEFEAEKKEQVLKWKATDADNDNLTFDVYFGQTISERPVIQNISKFEYKTTGLKNSTTYLWKVVAKDGTDSIESEERSFSIKKEELKGVYLEWQNVNASAYDLYFGEGSASQKILSNTKETAYLFQNLEEGKKYYYKVVPKGSSHKFNENYFFYKNEGVKIFDGNVILKNHEQIKGFGGIRFTEITGLLQIKQDYQQNINELGWLKNLKKVGSLHLSYISGLTSLYGLHNISSVSRGDISITNVPDISEIIFDNLRFIKGSLSISGNKNLEKVSMNRLSNIYGSLLLGGDISFLNDNYRYIGQINKGYGNAILSSISFDGLKYIGGDICIYKNESLKNLFFLSNINGTYKDLIVWDNDELIDISALSKFTAVAQSLAIVDNNKLSNLKGLENISIVAIDMLISENSDLESINLDNLRTIGKVLIMNNPKLENLSGLNSVRNIAKGLSIYQNNLLNNFCGLKPLFRNGNVRGGTYIRSNKYNPSIWKILNGFCSQ